MQNISVEISFCMSHKIEIGAFAAAGIGYHSYTSTKTKRQNDYQFGTYVVLQLLPFFIDDENLRFKVYTKGRVGLNYSKFNDTQINDNIHPNGIYGLYLGGAYYFTKNLGVLFEGGYEKMHEAAFNNRLGLSIKL